MWRNKNEIIIAENLKSVIAKQETRCMELEKASTDNESKKKKAQTDVKAIEEKLSKQESLVWPQNNLIIQVSDQKTEEKKTDTQISIFFFFFGLIRIHLWCYL